MSVPVSEVGKHFPNEKRTVATGIVTAAASVGYFIAPLFTTFSLQFFGWEITLKYFLYFILFGLIASIFLKRAENFSNTDLKSQDNQTFVEAIKQAFSHRGYVLLVAGFFVCGFQITLVATHIPAYMKLRGMDLWSPTIILSLIGLFNIVGTLGMGI